MASLIAGAALAPDLGRAASAGRGAVGPLAPNGRPWPSGSGYIEAYPLLNRTGLSEVTVDNRAHPAAMFVKLMALDGPTRLPVRSFLVAAGSRFTLANLTTGTYELRFQDVNSGVSMRSSPFILEEVSTPTGLQHSSITIVLDAPGQGSARSYSLSDSEF